MKITVKKIISIIVFLSVIIVLISSTIFIVKHINHHCTDKNCPICIELVNSNSIISNLGNTCAIVFCYLAFVIGYIAYRLFAGFSLSNNTTLISLKVELLN